MHTQWYPGKRFSAKKQRPVIVRAVVSIAQHPRLPPIVTLFQVMTKAWDNVNEVVQLIPLLSVDVTYTIDQLEKKQDKQARKKKVKDIRNVTQKSTIFMFVQMSSISGTSVFNTPRQLMPLG